MPATYQQPDRRFHGETYDYITAGDELPTYDHMGSDPLCKVKLFLINSRWTYYVAALTLYDDQPVLTGWCVSALGPDCDEWGDSSLTEIMELRAPRMGLPVERDLYFTPVRLRELRAQLAEGKTP